MHTITIGNKPYVAINESLLLVIASWGDLKLLFSDAKPSFKDIPFHVPDAKSGYHWVGQDVNLYSRKPRGIITGLSFEGTLFKFFNWVIRYNNINVAPNILNAMVQRAMDTPSFDFLPDPLSILERNWVQDKEVWRQRGIHDASASTIFRTIVPEGLVAEDPVKQIAMRGIAISDAPPPSEVLNTHLFAPYMAALPQIRTSLQSLTA
jgi:hypothetical protein